ncbi:hypothetical protein L5515_009517 [Caenorhabditis briggsae]|uniref:Uncharacterized protein n=1 Tax=Caenorhabditis briggsae TaxID=6238 RepID=A0AAE9F3Q0_CAEBR|nr:hypothetical protein L5515_009517 [Caenorhabditis briggsae]
MEEKFLSYFNNKRMKIAKQSTEFANVWKLEWSTALAKKINDLPKDCKKLSRNDYRFFLMKNDLNDAAWLKWEEEEHAYCKGSEGEPSPDIWRQSASCSEAPPTVSRSADYKYSPHRSLEA